MRIMNESLKAETEKLGRARMQHDSAWLKDYLVAGVEDPRLNLQSILARHFLVREFAGERFAALMGHEYRFAAALSWLMKLPAQAVTAEDFEAILHGLRRGADNAEGLEIPRYVLRIFQALPAESLGVPNYIE